MLPNDNVSMSVGHLDHVLTVYSSMEHVTWTSPSPTSGWTSRIPRPDSCILVCSWSKVPLIHLVCRCASLSTTFALSQSMTWSSSTPWSVIADLWVTLLSLAVEARVCVSVVVSLLSCAPWSSDQTSCLYPQCITKCPTDIETLSLGNRLQLCRVRRF